VYPNKEKLNKHYKIKQLKQKLSKKELEMSDTESDKEMTAKIQKSIG
jgi:hypothetical protein